MVLLSASLLGVPDQSLQSVNNVLSLIKDAPFDFIHVDVLDGSFVPFSSLWKDSSVVSSVLRVRPFDVHLMVSDVDSFVDSFLPLKPSFLSFHVEAVSDPVPVLRKIRSSGVKAGLAVNPETPVSSVVPFLSFLDFVLVMGVHPGRSGQSFIPDVLDKVVFLKKSFPDLLVFVDGGVSKDNLSLIVSSGADLVVAGSAIFGSGNPVDNISFLKSF